MQDKIRLFQETQMRTVLRSYNAALKGSNRFTNEFPIECIMDLDLEEYVMFKRQYCKNNTFCRKLLFDVKEIEVVGSIFPVMFDVFSINSIKYHLSPTYSNTYGEDIEDAFFEVKSEIVTLLKAAAEDDIKRIKKTKVYHLIRDRLLTVYYPDKYVPIAETDNVDRCLKHLGIKFSDNEDMIFRNIALRNWASQYKELSEWNNYILMAYCQWLYDNEIMTGSDSFFSIADIKNIKSVDEKAEKLELTGCEKEEYLKIKENSGEFRHKMLYKYGRCCMCGISNSDMLIASHIKQDRSCTFIERLDVNNGILLCPNHERLFSKGLISCDENGRIMISNRLSDSDKAALKLSVGTRIRVDEGNQKYLEYHRNHVFKNSTTQSAE